MATSGWGSGLVGRKAQAAVDVENHLIVARDVTNECHDRDQLASRAKEAKAALGRTEMGAIADKGYFRGHQILACHEAGITTTVPRSATSGNRTGGMYVKDNFAWARQADTGVPSVAHFRYIRNISH